MLLWKSKNDGKFIDHPISVLHCTFVQASGSMAWNSHLIFVCSTSCDIQKALSRKGSSRIEKRPNEEQEADDATEKIAVKGNYFSNEPRSFYLLLMMQHTG